MAGGVQKLLLLKCERIILHMEQALDLLRVEPGNAKYRSELTGGAKRIATAAAEMGFERLAAFGQKFHRNMKRLWDVEIFISELSLEVILDAVEILGTMVCTAVADLDQLQVAGVEVADLERVEDCAA